MVALTGQFTPRKEKTVGVLEVRKPSSPEALFTELRLLFVVVGLCGVAYAVFEQSSLLYLALAILLLPALFVGLNTDIVGKSYRSKVLLYLTTAQVLSGVIPFVAWFFTSLSWTGQVMEGENAKKISVHIKVLLPWFVFASIQLVSIMSSSKTAREVHRRIGKFALYVWIPLMMTELATNAIVVFMEKPFDLAHKLYGSEASSGQIFLCALSLLPAWFGLPLRLLMHWLGGARSLGHLGGNRNITRHKHHMFEFLLGIMLPGQLRVQLKVMNVLGNCPQMQSGVDVMTSQVVGFQFNMFIDFLRATLYMAMLPRKERKGGVLVAYLVFFATTSVGLMSLSATGHFWPSCQ